MAELQALREALQRIGFSEEASEYITDDQGLDEVEEFRILSDDEVENLCKNTRRPGGIIDNPNRGRNNPASIPNPGIPVSLKAENNLKLMCYYIRHQDRISRTVRIKTSILRLSVIFVTYEMRRISMKTLVTYLR